MLQLYHQAIFQLRHFLQAHITLLNYILLYLQQEIAYIYIYILPTVTSLSILFSSDVIFVYCSLTAIIR